MACLRYIAKSITYNSVLSNDRYKVSLLNQLCINLPLRVVDLRLGYRFWGYCCHRADRNGHPIVVETANHHPRPSRICQV